MEESDSYQSVANVCQWLVVSSYFALKCETITVGPGLIGPIVYWSIGLFHLYFRFTFKERCHLYFRFTFKKRWSHIKNYHLGPQNVDLYWWKTFKSESVIAGFNCTCLASSALGLLYICMLALGLFPIIGEFSFFFCKRRRQALAKPHTRRLVWVFYLSVVDHLICSAFC